jgi:general secretion pathway protein I
MRKLKFWQTGFTLLEVIVAMAIIGLVLGSVFSLLAGSKRLAFKAADDIEQTLFLRSAMNAAQVLEEPKYPELPERYKKNVTMRTDKVLEKSERQTRPLRFGLEPYTFLDKEKNLEISTLRWKELDTAQ